MYELTLFGVVFLVFQHGADSYGTIIRAAFIIFLKKKIII